MLRVVFALCVLALLHFSAFARNTGPNPQFEAWPELNRYLPPKSSLGKMERFGHDGAALIWGCFYYSEGWKLCYPQGAKYAYAMRRATNGWELWAKAEREKLLFASDNARKFANDGSLPVSAPIAQESRRREKDRVIMAAINKAHAFSFLPVTPEELGPRLAEERIEHPFTQNGHKMMHYDRCGQYQTPAGQNWKICFDTLGQHQPINNGAMIMAVYEKQQRTWVEWVRFDTDNCSTRRCKVTYQSSNVLAAVQANGNQEDQRKQSQKPTPVRKVQQDTSPIAPGIPQDIGEKAERAIGSAIKGLFGR